jgi:hypothetical protein
MKVKIIRIQFLVVLFKLLILGAEIISRKMIGVSWRPSKKNSVAYKLKNNSRLPPLIKNYLRPYNKFDIQIIILKLCSIN